MSYIWALRDLPRIKGLEALLHAASLHSNPKWAPEAERAQALADDISKRVFGITERDTQVNLERRRTDEAVHEEISWEQNFEFEDGDEIQITDIGWDVLAADGGELLSAPYFRRQIICATFGIMGHLPGAELSDAAAAQAASGWGSTMEADLATWRQGRRRS